MPLSDDAIKKWENILAEVNKTDVPLQCVKKVIIKFRDGKQRTINFHTLLRQGMQLDQIEELLTRILSDLDDSVRDLDFVLDVNTVAAMIQPQTDKLLEKINK